MGGISHKFPSQNHQLLVLGTSLHKKDAVGLLDLFFFRSASAHTCRPITPLKTAGTRWMGMFLPREDHALCLVPIGLGVWIYLQSLWVKITKDFPIKPKNNKAISTQIHNLNEQ